MIEGLSQPRADLAAIVGPVRIGGDLEARAIMQFEELRDQNRRRVAAKIAGEIADAQLAGGSAARAVIQRGDLKALRGGARDAQLLRRTRRHAQNRKWMRRRRARVQKPEQFGLFVLDPAPVADPAPLVMEPDANRDEARIELHRRAVAGDRLGKPAEGFKSRAEIGVRVRQRRAQGDRLAIGLDRALVVLLTL